MSRTLGKGTAPKQCVQQGLTTAADYVRVYVQTGILDALIAQLYHDGGGNSPKITKAKFHTKWEDQIGERMRGIDQQ